MSQPTFIGDYQIGRCLGRGGFGAVYQGVDITTGTFVAIKQMKRQNLPKDQLASMMGEIDLLKKLNHPNIVKYIGYSETREFLCIILEYVESGSLASVVQTIGKFPESLVRVYIEQVLQGLLYLHEQGVIHRDIKGANILTTKGGTVKLADFGIAAEVSSTAENSSIMGTPYWMAPEIIELNGATTKSDIWSVGCTVIELITGEPPYYDLAQMPALFRIVQDDHPPLPEGISPALRDFLLQCFQKEPRLRISAKKLLKHPWVSKKSKTASEPVPQTLDEVKDGILAYNEKLEENKRQSVMVRPSSAKKKDQAAPTKAPAESSATSPFADDNDDEWGNFEIGSDSALSAFTMATASAESPKKKPASKKKVGTKKDGTKKTTKTKKDGTKKTKKKATKLKDAAPKKPDVSKFVDDDDDDDFGFDIGGLADKIGLKKPSSSEEKPKIAPRLIHPDDLRGLGGADMVTAGGLGLSRFKDDEEEDWDDFGEDDVFDAIDKPDAGPTDGQEDFAAQLRKKLTSGPMDEEEEEDPFGDEDDDPFADVFDDFDEPDFERDIARDNYARVSSEILKLLAVLQAEKSEESKMIAACEELIFLFKQNPDQKSRLIRHHGVIPIMEVLEVTKASMLRSILQLVNQIIEDNTEIQENLCLVGGIPAIMKFAAKEYPKDVRLETARFIKQMCATSTLTLQMFIACRGLPLLVENLQTTNYRENRELVHVAIDGIMSVFHLQSPTPKNDFCRLFVKCDVLKALAHALLSTIKNSNAREYSSKVVEIFLLFSHGDAVVKRHIADSSSGGVLELVFRAMDLMRMSLPSLLLNMLKCVKQLSMDTNTLASLQSASAIPKLIGLFNQKSSGTELQKEMDNQILGALYNLTRISKERQEQAALAGIIPHLQNFIANNSPLKQFALSMVIDLAHCRRARKELWKNNGIEFYLKLLREEYWNVNALDSISTWLSEEPQPVGDKLLVAENVSQIVQVFIACNPMKIGQLVQPLLHIVNSCAPIGTAMLNSTPEFMNKLVERLMQKKQDAEVRVNLLKLLAQLYEGYPDPDTLANKHNLARVVSELTHEKSLVIQGLASKLEQAILKAK
eukprot:TRINITY_DN11643_c0_g1_i1.p1 TRINITY_DN11643_c0_g1~~TRINITY_DN11643_c0_g1_i1.p1  ORF type:complete len:1085 (-),score=383.55 TRINITY_DN11643_c0_g1_i1:312-3566(-)